MPTTAAWLWARADIRRRWPSLVLLAVMVALAVGAVLALVAGAQRAGTAVDTYLDAVGTAEVVVFSDADASPDLLASLADDPRIERVERSVVAPIAPSPVQPGENAYLFVGIDDPLAGVGRPPLLTGRYPEPGAPDEIVVNERMAATQHLRVGQRVSLRALPCFVYADCPPEPIGDVTIVGVARLPTDLVDDPAVEAITLAGTSLLDGRWRDYPRPAAITWIHLHDRSDTAAVVSAVAVRVVDGTVDDNVALLGIARRAARWQRNALVIAAFAAGSAGLLVVAQALSRHLAARAQDVPTLAALGLTPRRRWAAALLASGPAVVGGVAGAIALAFVLSPLLPLGVARRADPDLGLRSDGLLIGAAWSIAAVSVVAGLVAARWTVRADPDRPGQPSVAARLTTGLALRPVPATGARLALERRQGAARLPVVATLVALIGTTAVVVGALVVAWSLHGLVERPERFGQAWDVRVDYFGGDLRDGATTLAADPRVAAVAISLLGELNIAGRDGGAVQVGTMGLEGVTGRSALTVIEGRAPSGTREIALASTTMDTLGLGLGDTAMASGACGAAELTVVGRVIVPLSDDTSDPDRGSVVSPATVDELCAQGLVSSLDENANALVRFRDGVSVSAVRDEWRSRGLSVDDREVPGTIASLSDIRQVPVLVAVLVALLGAAAAAHALMLGVRRRSHDFAVLRALGLRPRQAGGIVHWQAATLALVAVVAGVPLGVLLGRVVWRAIAQPSNVVVRIDVVAAELGLLAAATMLLALTLSIWPAHRASSLRPASLLRSE